MNISNVCATFIWCFVYIYTHGVALCEYTNTWAIETDSEANAKRIAQKYNFEYAGKIGTLDNYFLLEKKSFPRRRKRSGLKERITLDIEPTIQWSQQQKVLKRVKRRFRDNMYKDQWYLENNGKALTF